ncbi:MAG TPA: hypothetical protein V6C88_14960 [Chroococcidiopsis sp.]
MTLVIVLVKVGRGVARFWQKSGAAFVVFAFVAFGRFWGNGGCQLNRLC